MKKKYEKPIIESKEEFERIALLCNISSTRTRSTCDKAVITPCTRTIS